MSRVCGQIPEVDSDDVLTLEEQQEESFHVPPPVLPLPTVAGDIVTPFDNQDPDRSYTWPIHTLRQ